MIKTPFKRLITVVDILLITIVSYAQNQNDTVYQYQDEVEQLMEYSDDETSKNYDDDIIELHERFSEPININTVTKEVLRQFPFLSELQIENILAYLYLHGEMQTIYELQLISDIDWQTIRYMLPFFVARPMEKKTCFPSFNELLTKGRSEVLTRLDIPFYRTAGYADKYLGTPYYHSLRYAYRYRDKVFAGFSAEKDRGEAFFASYNRQGYDNYSMYVLVKDVGRLKTLVVGDYRLSFGQGLVVSNNFLLGKTTYMTTLQRRGNHIGKHTSSDEQHFFRGVAASVEIDKHWQLSSFFSYRQLDGTINEGCLTSIHTSGLHRTEKEVNDRHNLGLLFTGANINYSGSRWQAGATGIYYQFSKPYMPAEREYNSYALRGASFYNIGIDYSYHSGKLSVVGEGAIGKRGVATINRLQYVLKQGYNLILFHRYFAHNYWAYFAHTLSEGSNVQNENGWFVAVDMVPSRKLTCFVAIDLISFPWWRYRISKPSKAIDGIWRCSYYPKQTMRMDFYYRYKQKERDVTGSGGMDTRPIYRHSFRYRWHYLPVANIKLCTIADYCLFRQQGFDMEKGCQLTQSLTYSLGRYPLQATLQGTYFSTDSYDTRVYVSERSLLYNTYMPSFQGAGFHLSFRFQYKIGSKWLLIAHCAHTKYHHQQSIGSGSDKINSNQRTDLKLQLRYKI